MRIPYTLYVIGALLCSVGLTMLFPVAVSIYYGDSGLMPLLYATLITVGVGAGLFLGFKERTKTLLNHKGGMLIVALAWLAVCVAGALPYYIGGYASFTDACFESVSGFTTTGSTIFADIEILPHGILMWRSLTHWLGGMGIIVLSLAILPFLGVGGMQLYKAEVPGPTPDKLTPRIKDTAMTLWKVYLFFTVVQVILLALGGMSLFDSVCHTFGTMATGGFSTKNASIGYYDSAYIQWVIIAFMFIAGVNFTLHFKLFMGDYKAFWNDEEFRFYALVTLVCTAIIACSIYGANYIGLGDSIRQAAFQVISICTTTGFATANYELWPSTPQALLLALMFLGGCAGSTAGSIKCMRALLLFKQASHELSTLIHPRSISHVKFGKTIVRPEVFSGILGFVILYLGLYALSSVMVAATGVDVLTAYTATAACIGNVGPGLGSVGPAENFGHLPELAKWLLSWCMLLGRLEIYTVFILFVPEFWRK